MAKYTTELRHLVDLEYDFQLDLYPIFDETYRETLNAKILDHYRYREIGFETPARFRHQLKSKMNEIMPYYNQQYASQLIVINPLYTVDYNETSAKQTDGSAVQHGTNVSDRDSTMNTDNTQTRNLAASGSSGNTQTKDLITSDDEDVAALSVDSDAPAGMIAVADLKSNTYASKATRQENTRGNVNTQAGTVIDAGSTSQTDTGTIADAAESIVDEVISNTADNTNTITNLDDYVRHVVGHEGRSHSELLEEFRKTFLNIDLQIIKDLNILFMGVY